MSDTFTFKCPLNGHIKTDVVLEIKKHCPICENASVCRLIIDPNKFYKIKNCDHFTPLPGHCETFLDNRECIYIIHGCFGCEFTNRKD